MEIMSKLPHNRISSAEYPEEVNRAHHREYKLVISMRWPWPRRTARHMSCAGRHKAEHHVEKKMLEKEEKKRRRKQRRRRRRRRKKPKPNTTLAQALGDVDAVTGLALDHPKIEFVFVLVRGLGGHRLDPALLGVIVVASLLPVLA